MVSPEELAWCAGFYMFESIHNCPNQDHLLNYTGLMPELQLLRIVSLCSVVSSSYWSVTAVFSYHSAKSILSLVTEVWSPCSDPVSELTVFPALWSPLDWWSQWSACVAVNQSGTRDVGTVQLQLHLQSFQYIHFCFFAG